MKEECLICKAPLEYLETDEVMECAICHRKENSKTRCEKGIMYVMSAILPEWMSSSGCVWKKVQRIRLKS